MTFASFIASSSTMLAYLSVAHFVWQFRGAVQIVADVVDSCKLIARIAYYQDISRRLAVCLFDYFSAYTSIIIRDYIRHHKYPP